MNSVKPGVLVFALVCVATLWCGSGTLSGDAHAAATSSIVESWSTPDEFADRADGSDEEPGDTPSAEPGEDDTTEGPSSEPAETDPTEPVDGAQSAPESERQREADRPKRKKRVAQRSDRKPVEVAFAVWGRKGRWVDATHKIQARIDQGKKVWARTKDIGAGDPAPGKTKRLVALIKVDGRHMRTNVLSGSAFTVHDAGDEFWVPGPPLTDTELAALERFIDQPPQRPAVLSCRFGVGKSWVIATDAVNRRRIRTGNVYSNHKAHKLPDPAPGKHKVLVAAVGAGSKVVNFTLKKGGWVDITPTGNALKRPK